MNEERKNWLRRAPQEERAKKLRLVGWILSASVIILVSVMQKIKIPMPEGWDTSALPRLHAALNTTVAVTLLFSLGFVGAGKIRLHRFFMTFAMLLSVAFLLSYVTYHITTKQTTFGGTGMARTGYLILLATHILAAAVSLPLVLFTYIHGLTNHFHAHVRMARWVFPLWLYVAVTGPVCYWMLRPYY